MSSALCANELRLVVLGATEAGSRPAACSILSLGDSEQGAGQECSKHRGAAAGRQVAVVSSPAWFKSSCSPEDRRKHISSFIALSSPGPHAFLLCVPVSESSDDARRALAALEALFGPAAVSGHTVVLFTRTEELGEDEELEDYIVTWRKDLQALVGRCGDRYHTLERRGGEGAEEKAVEELLEKVEQALKERDVRFFSCPLYEGAEERVRARQEEILRGRSHPSPAGEADTGAARDEAERSVAIPHADIEAVFSSSKAPPPSSPPSLLRGLWEKMVAWIRWLPTLVRREALMGALVGLFVGGPYGGMVGATVGSVATEVGRRKTRKTE